MSLELISAINNLRPGERVGFRIECRTVGSRYMKRGSVTRYKKPVDPSRPLLLKCFDAHTLHGTAQDILAALPSDTTIVVLA